MANTNKIISIIFLILAITGVAYYASTHKKPVNEIVVNQVGIPATDLQGNWFTPHAAIRNLNFSTNSRFNFNDGSGNTYSGNYSTNQNVVTLHFDDKSQKDMELIYSAVNDVSPRYKNFYLKNDSLGEYFVKGDQ